MRRWLPPSLRTRLALWYLLVLGLVLAVFAAGVYWEVRKSLLDGVDAALNSRAVTVLNQVSGGARGVDYRGGEAPHANAELAVYLFDRRGRLRYSVAGSPRLLPRPVALDRAWRDQESHVTLEGQRLYTVRLTDSRGRIYGAIQVIQSLDGVQDTLRELLASLVLAIPALLIVATAGGVFLAGRALDPIDRITRTARLIEAGNLRGRLGPTPRDDEVGRLAATFDDMLDRLERSFAQQRRFVADASHELRTPLTIIRSDLDILRRHPRPVVEHEAFEEGFGEEVTRLSALVEDLLTLARADSGQAELEQDLVYLDAVVDEAAGGLSRLAAARGVAVETYLERDIAVIGDPARLRQLVTNLLDNAVKYTPPGGRVGVTLRGHAASASLAVSDTGIGIAPDALTHVFDRFFRADEARGRAEGGTGLGLSIAHWCAEAHGGHIAVESRLDVGSMFTVTLPRALIDDEEEPSDAGRAARPMPHAGHPAPSA